MRIDDPAHVAAQYATSANLDARVRIYRRFDTDPELGRIRAHVTRQIALCGAFHIQIAGAAITAAKQPARRPGGSGTPDPRRTA